ncbi:MAG: YqiJ family protein [Gammaproteobacteria bacterium]
MELLFHESTWLFSAAIGLVLLLSILESVGWLLGHGGLSSLFDHGLDGHGVEVDGHEGMLSWLHLGRVPLTILLILFLSAFGISGFVCQILAQQWFGRFLPLAIVAASALFVAVAVVRVLGGLFARVIPKDQSFAVSPDDLVGLIATVTTGTAKTGLPAQARVKDSYGTTHYVMVEPDASRDEFPTGTEVLLLQRVAGNRFRAILNPLPDLL